MDRVRSSPPPPVATGTAPARPATSTAPNAIAPQGQPQRSSSPDGYAGSATDRRILGDGSSGAAPVTAEQGGLASGSRSLFELVPGRYPDAIGLDTLLQQAATTPEGRAAVEQLLSGFEQKTGVVIPQEVRTQVLSGARSLTSVLAITPQQLSEGISTLNVAQKVRKAAPEAAPRYLLPQHFELSKLDAVAYQRTAPELKQLVPGIYQGDLPSTLSDAQLKRNTVTAEIFDRLSANPKLPASQQFSVGYGGKSYTRLDDFLGALRADGYQVSVTFEQRIANFSDLKTPVPGSNPPRYLDVPAPLLVRTGIKDASGHEAIVPACHSEMHIQLQSGPSTRGPRLDAEVRFFQGTDGTGFFPAGGFAEPSWCGHVKSAPVTGDAAVHAAQLAGLLTGVINGSASRNHLWAGGYGVTGVCNDSVAVVEHAITGQVTEYPLLMRDAYVLGEINRELPSASRADAHGLRELAASVSAVPNDLAPNASQAARALASMPWADGAEPLQSAVEARRILLDASR